MKFTRKHDICRLQVLVLDPNIIPQFVDVVIGDYLYGLQFRVEENIDEENPEPMDMDFGFDANGGGADAGDLTKKYHTPADNDKNKQAKHSSTQPGSNKGTPPSQNTVTRPTTMASAGTVLLAEAKAFADPAELTAIPEASVSELRRSKRVASTSDEEVMHQATRFRADKDNAVQSSKR